MKPDRLPRKMKLYPVVQIVSKGSKDQNQNDPSRTYQKQWIKDGTRFDMQDGRQYVVKDGSIRHLSKTTLTKKERNKRKKAIRETIEGKRGK